jgi:predicted transcriptional regulator
MEFFTERELIDALEQARSVEANAAGALTMDELVKATGRSRNTLRRELWQLKNRGLLEVRRVKKQRIDGVWTGTAAYRILTDESAIT